MRGSALVFFVVGLVLIWLVFTGRLQAVWSGITNPPSPGGGAPKKA